MHLSTRIAYNTIVQIISKIASTILGLLAIAIMTRYLGKEGFGQYTTIITFLSFFSIAIDLGLTLVTAQMISRPGVDQNRILSNLFSFRFLSAIIFLGIAPIIVLFFPYESSIKLGVVIYAFVFLFVALNQVFVGLFQKNLRLDKVAIAELAGRVVLVAGIIAVVYFNYGLLGIIIISVISSAVNFLLHYCLAKKFARVRFVFDKTVWQEIIKKSWPLALTIVFNLIYLKTDTLILSLIKTQAEVGIYGAAYRVIDVLITVPFMFAGVVLPIITLAWAEKNLEQFKKVFQKSFDLMAVLAAPLAIGAQFMAKPVMIFVAGGEFGDSGTALRILILAASIIFLNSIFAHGIVAIDQQKKIINAYIFTALTAVIGYLIFIPSHSYLGAAWVTVYSELAIMAASIYIFCKNSKIIPNPTIFLKSVTAALIMALGLLTISKMDIRLNLFFLLSLATLIYFTALYLLGGITKADVMILFQNNKK